MTDPSSSTSTPTGKGKRGGGKQRDRSGSTSSKQRRPSMSVSFEQQQQQQASQSVSSTPTPMGPPTGTARSLSAMNLLEGTPSGSGRKRGTNPGSGRGRGGGRKGGASGTGSVSGTPSSNYRRRRTDTTLVSVTGSGSVLTSGADGALLGAPGASIEESQMMGSMFLEVEEAERKRKEAEERKRQMELSGVMTDQEDAGKEAAEKEKEQKEKEKDKEKEGKDEDEEDEMEWGNIEDFRKHINKDVSNEEMRRLLEGFNEDQLNRYETYRRVGFSRAMVKRLMASMITGLHVAPNAAIVVSGCAKLFVGEMVEKALEIMSEWSDAGPIRPEHLREAYRRYKNERGGGGTFTSHGGVLMNAGTQHGSGFGFSSGGAGPTAGKIKSLGLLRR